MIEYNCVVYEIHSLAVMIYDHNVAAFVVNLRRVQKGRTVHIGYNEQRLAVYKRQRLRA